MSNPAELPEKRKTSSLESIDDASEAKLGASPIPAPPPPDATDEPRQAEADDMLLELPEDELLDIPEAEGVRVTHRASDEGDDAVHDRQDPTAEEEQQRIGDEVFELASDSRPNDTEILSKALTEDGEATPEAGTGIGIHDANAASLPEASPPAPASAEDGSVSEGDADVASRTELENAEEPAEAPILVRAPDGADLFALSELIIEPSGRPLGETAARWIGRILAKLEEATTPDGDIDEPRMEAWIRETVLPSIATGEAPDEIAESFSFTPAGVSEETSVRDRLRGDGKKKSLLGELVGIVLGGVGGLLIAYYALNWFGGPRYDFANIPLPGIKHTYRHAPPWLKAYLQPIEKQRSGDSEGSSPDSP